MSVPASQPRHEVIIQRKLTFKFKYLLFIPAFLLLIYTIVLLKQVQQQLHKINYYAYYSTQKLQEMQQEYRANNLFIKEYLKQIRSSIQNIQNQIEKISLKNIAQTQTIEQKLLELQKKIQSNQHCQNDEISKKQNEEVSWLKQQMERLSTLLEKSYVEAGIKGRQFREEIKRIQKQVKEYFTSKHEETHQQEQGREEGKEHWFEDEIEKVKEMIKATMEKAKEKGKVISEEFQKFKKKFQKQTGNDEM